MFYVNFQKYSLFKKTVKHSVNGRRDINYES